MNSAGRDVKTTPAHSTMRCEVLLLADQLRDWTRDDPRLAPRTLRLRELLDELLEHAATPVTSDAMPSATAAGARISLEPA